MSEWSTDVAAAPRGEDVLVAVQTYSDSGVCLTQIGQLIWEPVERDPDDSDEDEEGYWATLDGKTGIYFWHTNDDGHVPKGWLKAWRPLPAPFVAKRGQ